MVRVQDPDSNHPGCNPGRTSLPIPGRLLSSLVMDDGHPPVRLAASGTSLRFGIPRLDACAQPVRIGAFNRGAKVHSCGRAPLLTRGKVYRCALAVDEPCAGCSVACLPG